MKVRRHGPACPEQYLGEYLRRGDAYRVIAVRFVDRRARYRLGQLPLAAGRHDTVPGRDHHRGGDIDLADPAVRGELADGLDSCQGGAKRGPAQRSAGPRGGGRVIYRATAAWARAQLRRTPLGTALAA